MDILLLWHYVDQHNIGSDIANVRQRHDSKRSRPEAILPLAAT